MSRVSVYQTATTIISYRWGAERTNHHAQYEVTHVIYTSTSKIKPKQNQKEIIETGLTTWPLFFYALRVVDSVETRVAVAVGSASFFSSFRYSRITGTDDG